MKFWIKLSIPSQIFILIGSLVYLLAPIGFELTNNWTFNQTDIGPYALRAYGYAASGLGTFLVTALILGPKIQRFSEPFWNRLEPQCSVKVAQKALWFLMLFLIGLTAINYALTPIKWYQVFSSQAYGNQGLLFRRNLYSPYLEGFTDSFISLQILSLFYGLRALQLTCFWGLPFVLALFTGWRYRIILPLLACWQLWVLKGYEANKSLWRPILFSVVLIASVLILTMNRWALAHKDWKALTLNPKQLWTETPLLAEFNQIKIFAILLKDEAENGAEYFNGTTFTKDVWVRIKPKSLFEGNQKPLSPWLKKVLNVTQSENAQNGLPAPGIVEEYYFAFGPIGLLPLFALLALILSAFPKWVTDRPFSNAVGLSAGALIFQAITRGYTPQHIELAVFLGVPFVLFYLFGKMGSVFFKR